MMFFQSARTDTPHYFSSINQPRIAAFDFPLSLEKRAIDLGLGWTGGLVGWLDEELEDGRMHV
jgi:hypothetical protein